MSVNTSDRMQLIRAAGHKRDALDSAVDELQSTMESHEEHGELMFGDDVPYDVQVINKRVRRLSEELAHAEQDAGLHATVNVEWNTA